MNGQTAETMMERTKELIRNGDFRRGHAVNPERDFIRQRKLGFPETMIYVLGNCRESMELNAEKFAEAGKPEIVSAAALRKARAKIGWEAFREVFEECAARSPVGKLY